MKAQQKPARKWSLLTWVGVAGGLHLLALALAFWPVLGADTVFVAPDAPILPPTGLWAAWRTFFALPTLPALLDALFPYTFTYEGSFWVDSAVMAFAGGWLLRARGHSAAAACVGGLCAAWCGYFATLFCAGHRGVVDALAVTALAFGALERLAATGRLRWGAALGVILAFGLGSQADIWLLMVCALSAYGLWRLGWRVKRWPWLALLAAVVAFGLIGFPALRHTFGAARETRAAQLAAATADGETPPLHTSDSSPRDTLKKVGPTSGRGRPYLEARQGLPRGDLGPTSNSPRSAPAARRAQSEAKWRFITGWSLPPEDLLEWLWPGIHGRTSYPFDPKPYTGRLGDPERGVRLRQHSVFVGWVLLVLALAAWTMRAEEPARQARRFWSALAAVTLLLALGRYTLLYRAVFWVPGLNQIRAPIKWLHLTGFALAMVAGVGAEGVIRRWGRWAAVALMAVTCLCGAWVVRGYVFPRSLAHNALTRAIPPGRTLCNPLGWRALDDLCRWQGIPLTSDLTQADYVVAPLPQPSLPPPVAVMQVQGVKLGLFRLRSGQRTADSGQRWRSMCLARLSRENKTQCSKVYPSRHAAVSCQLSAVRYPCKELTNEQHTS